MYIGDLRRRFFIDVSHEWNGVVRDMTAKCEKNEEVDPEEVIEALANFYRNRARLAIFLNRLHGEEA